MLRGLLAAALRFRLLLVGLAVGLIVIGAVSVRRMHADVVPELGSGPVLEVQTEALGLSSQEVEQYVTVPMENNLLDGVMGVWDERSHSIPGLSTVDLYFEPGTTVLHARQLVEERLTNAFSLPNISKPPQLIQPLSTSSRALMIGLSSSSLDPLELSYLARWVVKARLSGVPGVANVTIFGQRDRQIQVQVDPSRLAASHVTLDQVIATAGNAQLVSPLSYLQGSAPGTGGFLDGPNQRLEVRPVLPLGAPGDLAAVPISGAPGHRPLGSVANVVEGHQPLIGDAQTEGAGSSLVLMVQKLPGASVLSVTRGVKNALGELRPALAGVRIDTGFFAPANYVDDAFGNLGLGALIAAALGLVALVAFSLDLRLVVIEALSIGCSLLIATLLLQLLGYTFNALVVLGLLIATAVIVDDSLQSSHEVVRRIRAHCQSEVAPIETAVLNACVEVRSTLGYATAIVLLSVVPVFFAKGPAATLVHPLVLSFALAVIVSLALALTLTPALAMLLFDRGRRPRRVRAMGDGLAAGYQRALRRGLRIPSAVLATVCMLGLAGVLAVPFLEPPAPPAFKDRNLVIQWAGPAGASLPEMDRITGRVLRQLRALAPVADVAATLGRAVSGDQVVDTSSGQLFVSIKPGANYGRAVDQVRAIVEQTPGMRGSVGTYESQVLSGVLTPPDHSVDVRVYGENYGQLASLAGQVQQSIAHLNGLGTPRTQLPAQEPNLQVAVNDDAAVRAGVLPGDARRAASTLVSGLTVGNFFQDQAVFDVVVIGAASVRGTAQAVGNLLIDAGGGHVRLADIARVTVQPDPIDIQHQALSRYVDVSAPVYSGSVSAAQAAVRAQLAQIRFPLAYHAEILGSTPEDPTTHLTFLSYVLAAMLGTLLLLQAAFASWRLAALFLLASPVGLAGGLIVAVLSDQAQSIGADAGLLALFALTVRQGMLQIAHLRRVQVRDGGPLHADLIVRAARDRLAPTLSAAVVIAAILLPFVVIGDVAGNELTHAAATVVLGGLLTSTPLTVLLVPVMCARLGPSTPVRAGGAPWGSRSDDPDEQLIMRGAPR